MLSVPDLTALLGISRADAYELVKRKDFPALHIGKRVLVPKDKLIAWIGENTGGGQAWQKSIAARLSPPQCFTKSVLSSTASGCGAFP